MSAATLSRPAPWQLQETELPWTSAAAEDARFRRLLKWGLGALCVLGVVISLVPVPELTREQAERVPPQLARVILEEKSKPKPPPPKPAPEPKREKPLEAKAEKPKPKPEPRPEPEPQTRPKPEPAPAKVQMAREKAANSGLLQMQDDLAAMRDTVDVAEVSRKATASGAAASSAQQVDRAVIANRAQTRSGGVSDSNLSRDTGGAELAQRQATRVASAQASNAARASARETRRETSVRPEDAIRSVMENNKGAIFAIYNRALRRDPTLQGKVTVQLVIEPNGSVSDIKLVGSELNAPALERKLLARIRLINFGAANVERATLNYSIDFLPS